MICLEISMRDGVLIEGLFGHKRINSKTQITNSKLAGAIDFGILHQRSSLKVRVLEFVIWNLEFSKLLSTSHIFPSKF